MEIQKGGGCSLSAAVIVMAIAAVVVIIYLSGALSYPLIPAAVDVATNSRVTAAEQMLFMVNPATVVAVLGILVVAALIALAFGRAARK